MSTLFADLGLPARLVDALAADGMTEAFPVQAITLPDALAGKDLCGRAPTGSGKTLGFGIPMMTRVGQAEPNKPTGLVLVPTRELAEQVQRAFVPLGRAQWRFIQAIYGGAAFGPQIHSLRKGASVIVATPGRLLDIIEKGYCDLSAVEVCVIDEADRMADLGFMPDVRKILDMTPATRQTMLWSATLDGDVQELIRDYMKDPVHHDLVGDVEEAPVDHRFVVTKPTDRLDSAVALIEEHGPTIVFVKTRFGVDDVSEDLNRAGVPAGALHGARSQAVRQRVLEDFKRGRVKALVATDVAARGIHVDNVSLVIHWDMPDNDKDYTHRSGRTGRAGNAGTVIAFVPPSRQRLAQRMSDAVDPNVTWERGEKPVERLAMSERSTESRDRSRHAPGASNRFDRDDRGPRSFRGDDRGGRGFDANDRGAPGTGGSGRFDRTSRAARMGGDRRDGAAGDRPFRGNDRPYADRRPAGNDGDRPYRSNDRGDRPYADRRPAGSDGDRPYRSNDRGDRPFGDRRPAAANGDRPYRSNDRPFADRRPAGNNGDRPFRPNDGRGDRPFRGNDRTDWAPRDRNDRGPGARPFGDRKTGTPGTGPARDRNDWSPRPRKDAGNDWTPRERGAGSSRPWSASKPGAGRTDARPGAPRPAGKPVRGAFRAAPSTKARRDRD